MADGGGTMVGAVAKSKRTASDAPRLTAAAVAQELKTKGKVTLRFVGGEPPAATPATPLERMALAISLLAIKHALEIGTSEAHTLANRTSKAVGLPPPFGNVDQRFANFAPYFGRNMSQAKSLDDAAHAAAWLVGRLFRLRAVCGVRWDDEKRDDVYAAVRRVLAPVTPIEWSNDETYEKTVRAVFRALGGSAKDANNLLRQRQPPRHKGR